MQKEFSKSPRPLCSRVKRAVKLRLGRELRRGHDVAWNEAKRAPVRFLGCSGTGFVIFGVAVHLPQIVKLRVSENIFHAQHRCHHGVILVVVFMHSVTAYQVQVRVPRVQFLANRGDVPSVVVIVNRIRFLLTNDVAIDEIAFLRQPDLNQLALCEFDQVCVAGIPETVMFETEILQAVTNLIPLGHHFGRPRSKILNTADFNAGVVNIDPIVIEHLSIFQNQHDSEEIALLELSAARLVRSLTAGDKPQTSWRIGADEMTCSASTVCRSPWLFLYSTIQLPDVSS